MEWFWMKMKLYFDEVLEEFGSFEGLNEVRDEVGISGTIVTVGDVSCGSGR
jgi:hypothetical protein